MGDDVVYNPGVYDGNFREYLNNLGETGFKQEKDLLNLFVVLEQEPKHKHLPGYDLYHSIKNVLEKKGMEINSANFLKVTLDDVLAFENEAARG